MIEGEGKGVVLILSHFLAIFRKLRTHDNEFAALFENLRVNLLQSIQLHDAVWSPEASEEANNDGALFEKGGGTEGLAVCISKIEGWKL